MKSGLWILLFLVAVLGSGCGGVSAGKSVSPLDFILPGLMQNFPPDTPLPNSTNDAPTLLSSISPG